MAAQQIGSARTAVRVGSPPRTSSPRRSVKPFASPPTILDTPSPIRPLRHRPIGRGLAAISRAAQSTSVLVPLAIFGVSRIVDGLILTAASTHQVALELTAPAYVVTTPVPASPGYLGVVSNWDGQWYRLIAEQGYPAALPRVDGHVAQNAWAFYPGYPYLVRFGMTLSGGSFPIVATVTSLLLGALAAVLVHRLLLPAGRFAAGATVACLVMFAASPVLQTAYSESLALVLVAGSLLALRHRCYGLVLVLGLALSVTRPVVLPLAAVVVAHGLVRFHRERGEFALRDRTAAVGLAALLVVSTGLWPLIAGLVTGRPDAFFATQAAWPANQGSGGLFGSWLGNLVTGTTPIRLVITVCLVAGVLLITLRRSAAVWGLELRVWALAYPLFILATARPTPSILRYGILAIAIFWPIPENPATRRDEVARWIVLGVLLLSGLATQFIWVNHVYTIQVTDGNIPYP